MAVSWPKYTRVETDTVCLVVETLTHGDVKVLTATGQIGILFCDEVVTYDPTGSGRHNGI